MARCLSRHANCGANSWTGPTRIEPRAFLATAASALNNSTFVALAAGGELQLNGPGGTAPAAVVSAPIQLGGPLSSSACSMFTGFGWVPGACVSSTVTLTDAAQIKAFGASALVLMKGVNRAVRTLTLETAGQDDLITLNNKPLAGQGDVLLKANGGDELRFERSGELEISDRIDGRFDRDILTTGGMAVVTVGPSIRYDLSSTITGDGGIAFRDLFGQSIVTLGGRIARSGALSVPAGYTLKRPMAVGGTSASFSAGASGLYTLAGNLSGDGRLGLAGPAPGTLFQLTGDNSSFSGLVEVTNRSPLTLGRAQALGAAGNLIRLDNGTLATSRPMTAPLVIGEATKLQIGAGGAGFPAYGQSLIIERALTGPLALRIQSGSEPGDAGEKFDVRLAHRANSFTGDLVLGDPQGLGTAMLGITADSSLGADGRRPGRLGAPPCRCKAARLTTALPAGCHRGRRRP